MIKKTIGIIGMGRFGKLISQLLDKNNHSIYFYDNDPKKQAANNFKSLADIATYDTVFLCVPISQIKNTLIALADVNCCSHTVIDTCSVKVYPVEMMKQYLPPSTTLIATHPMFGPDSLKSTHPKNMMMHFIQGNKISFTTWKKQFSKMNIIIHEMTPDQHDKEAAYSQAITHLIGRLLNDMALKPSSIGTLGYNNLLQLMEQTCHDSWELFSDMIHYNPYCKKMLRDFCDTTDNLITTLDTPTKEL